MFLVINKSPIMKGQIIGIFESKKKAKNGIENALKELHDAGYIQERKEYFTITKYKLNKVYT